MIFDVFRSQWVRLRRPALLPAAYAAVCAVAVLATVVLFAAANSAASTGSGPHGASLTLASLAGADGMLHELATSATLFGVLALALAVFLAGAISCATIAAVAAAFAMAPVRGVDTRAWTSASGLIRLGSTYGIVLLSVLGYGALGFGLAIALRSPAWSIAAGVAWLLPVETILAATVQYSARYLPGQLLSAIPSGGTSTLGYAHALQLGLPYAVAALAAAVLFCHRDVTS